MSNSKLLKFVILFIILSLLSALAGYIFYKNFIVLQIDPWIYPTLFFLLAVMSAAIIQQLYKSKFKYLSSKKANRLLITFFLSVVFFLIGSVFYFSSRTFIFHDLRPSVQNPGLHDSIVEIRVLKGMYYSPDAKMYIRDTSNTNRNLQGNPEILLQDFGGLEHINEVWPPGSVLLSKVTAISLLGLLVISIIGLLSFFVEKSFSKWVTILGTSFESRKRVGELGQDQTVFVSYSRSDGEFTLALASNLEVQGISCWVDLRKIEAGESWDDSIKNAINQSTIFLLVLSPESVSSSNVRNELFHALENKKEIIPIMIVETSLPFRINTLEYIDFTNDYEIAFQKLLSKLREPQMK